MAQVDLGKVRMTDAELSEKIIQTNGGVRFGKDADGKPGYVVTDAETGADTVVPFSSGGISNEGRGVRFANFIGNGNVFQPTATVVSNGSLDNILAIHRIEIKIIFKPILI